MAGANCNELQKQFLSDYATTGKFPKEWCEIQGLNYATARRPSKKQLRRVVYPTMRKMMKVSSACAITGLQIYRLVL